MAEFLGRGHVRPALRALVAEGDPPADQGTISVIGRVGNAACARLPPAVASTSLAIIGLANV
ncbi:MAG TPA: hypothetical protein PLO41_15925, partial [Rubrivivax sp.]|nr:hypothetical protein [Rubrivivax sp.]